jgi:thymidylate synthase
MKFANAAQAFVSLSETVMRAGSLVEVRGALTRELRQQSVTLVNPLDRCIVVSGRRNNVFATIAETIWVIAGRNDVGFLAPYLPRAYDFSDDGETWRAGYGPRLRNWNGTDQLEAVRKLLIADPATRRAVMSIFDPATDFASSKDVPCTNWLAFSLRDGVLDMSVAIRSNDLFWGFSGINTFEWSVLQELMAFWVGAEVGNVQYSINSLHVYERHFDRCETVIAGLGTVSAWSAAEHSTFATPAEEMETALEVWFTIEEELRQGRQAAASIEDQTDPLLRDFSRMLGAYWTFTRFGRDAGETALSAVADEALRAAGLDYFSWKSGVPMTTRPARVTAGAMMPRIIKLHRTKDRMYGDSWKKRGEQMAVLANIARKLDRLARFRPDQPDGAESWFDTAVDLFVYALKYKTFLLDATGIASPGMTAWSDGPEGFEVLARQTIDVGGHPEFDRAISAAEQSFQAIEKSVSAGDTHAARLELVDALIASGARVLESAYALRPAAAASEIAGW